MKLLYILFLAAGFSYSIHAQGLLEGDEPDPEYMVEQDSTLANLPLPSEILIVYNANVDSSESVANYYQQARNIPSMNLCPITDLPLSVNYGSEGGAYLINWYRDSTNFYNYPAEDGEVIISWVPPPDTSRSAHWLYYKDYIETPIKDYMDENNLTEDIRYIVLMKGLPYRLTGEYIPVRRISAAVCALLSLMNQPDERDILSLYNTGYSTQINPYLSVDYPPTLDYRFKSGHFENAGGWYLNYLVSRLDGDTYVDVIDLIDRSTSTDKSGEKKWILDNHPNISSSMPLAQDRLDELGFNYVYDSSTTKITSDNDDVIGYASHGIYSGFDSSYILTALQFQYANGAIFNSWESGNALSYGKWHWSHGLLSDFIVMGGSGGGGNAHEPLRSGVFREGDSYPAYAMGYSIVDAIYQGINYIAWQNDVIGDPLQTIAWGKQELNENLTWSGSNLVTGVISIPFDRNLAVEDNSHIELRHQGFIPCEVGYGRMYIGENVTFETHNWDRSLFLSYDTAYTRLIWADHPSFSSPSYLIYRKINSLSWEYITTTSANEYIDTEIEITCPECAINATVYYYLVATDSQEQTDTSNTVSGEVNAKLDKQILQNESKIYDYSLWNNYPNPFNPSTKIKYSLREDGIVSLKVYNILGSEVAELVNEHKPAGEYSSSFNFSNLASGTYFYVLRVNDFVSIRKMILLK